MAQVDREPQKKRARVNSEPEAVKDEKYWFASGDVVLIASRHVAFRVHGDILGPKSKVLCDLLDRHRRSSRMQEKLDDCPVVHVSDDSEDFRIFLGLVYDSFNFSQGDKLPNWSVVRVMVVLGDKYDVPEFRAEGVRRLSLEISQDASKWNEAGGFTFKTSELMSIASVTRSLNLPDVHAGVLYMCSEWLETIVLQGASEVGVDAWHLEDLPRCIHGHESMTRTWFDLHKKLFDISSLNMRCSSARHCAEAVRVMQFLSTDHAIQFVHMAFSILGEAAWEDLWPKAKDNGMCLSCQRFYQARLARMKQEFRNTLVERFTLPVVEYSEGSQHGAGR
ncbi:hypothetical protein NM688_g3529 [Phlebia brevispora]|uniref:Uncharacterized protein n=1 Tax=Phlebia brevispora TaxID=194682 RepID=A0ACC1T5B5_9APHY|nr:hypothetical protein NM688_g3529 [Phlebia brevispora]